MRRVFVDTSVILGVAWGEGTSSAIDRLVRDGGQELVVPAPVVSELLLKLEEEQRFADEQARKLDEVTGELRKRIEPGRPNKAGSRVLEELVRDLPPLGLGLGKRHDERRRLVREIARVLERSASTAMSCGVLLRAFELKEQVDRDSLSERQRSPGLRDCLVLAAVLEARAAEDLFLSFDRGLRSLASRCGLNAPEPAEFGRA